MIAYNQERSRLLAGCAVLIFSYFLIYSLFLGITHPVPALGDSWDYHIPISNLILRGDIFSPHNVKLSQWYYPGSAEAINSVLAFLYIPLTLSNIFAVLFLFFVLWKTAFKFGLDYYEGLFFSLTICTLNVVVRWYNAVSIDVWLVSFFLLSINLLESPKRSIKYFLILGFMMGMILGSKLTGVYYVVLLLFFYGKALLSYLNMKRALAFIIPFSVFGLFWYLRNLILFSNPFYPLYFFGLPFKIRFDMSVMRTALEFPKDMADAFFSEYKIWILSVPVSIAAPFLSFRDRLSLSSMQRRLLYISLVSLIIFLLSPTDVYKWIMVSSFRYSYPSLFPMILFLFILAKKYDRFELLSYIALGSMIMVTSFLYLPKLIIFYIPFAVVMHYFIAKYQKFFEKYILA